jgi:hypothetical protein
MRHGSDCPAAVLDCAVGSWMERASTRPRGQSAAVARFERGGQRHGNHHPGDSEHASKGRRRFHRGERRRTGRKIAEVVGPGPFRAIIPRCRQFDSGHTAMATMTAMPAPDTQQTALTRKMIVVAMHALPNSLGFRRSAPKKAPVDFCTRGCLCIGGRIVTRHYKMSPSRGAPAWRHGQGQALRVLRNLDPAGRGRTADASAPEGMSLMSHQRE